MSHRRQSQGGGAKKAISILICLGAVGVLAALFFPHSDPRVHTVPSTTTTTTTTSTATATATAVATAVATVTPRLDPLWTLRPGDFVSYKGRIWEFRRWDQPNTIDIAWIGRGSREIHVPATQLTPVENR